ncbi:MAG: hypothetical protein CMI74_03400 [Candidatus Pelagibacter sp.]|nr:hypothetical protein [Candidatus Pelagibacter sp.]OUW11764.1 MAG: hypothetical protein CBD26_01630 [Candidatus Pelagibacter sp. TMED166]
MGFTLGLINKNIAKNRNFAHVLQKNRNYQLNLMKRVLDYNSHSFTYNIVNNRVVNLKGLGYLDLLYLNQNRKKIECYILRIEKRNAILSKLLFKNKDKLLAI